MAPDGFDILYEQGHVLAVDKPGGVLTQAPPGIDSLEVRVKRFLAHRHDDGRIVYLGVPHRLDRPASGVLLLGLSIRTTRRLAEQFEGRLVRKTYLALVEGQVDPPQGTWTDYLRKVEGEARSEVVAPDAPGGRIAVLHYRRIGHHAGVSCLEIELETGRTHQIRVQAASRGFPILGDAQYGARQPFGPATDDPRDRWIALHARSLEFRHPGTHEMVSVSAPLPTAWANASPALPALPP
jgi:RluA family pseudouridine synthase